MIKIKKNIPLIDQHNKRGFYLNKFGGNFVAETAIKPAINYLISIKCKKIILGCTELPIAIFAFKSFKNIKSSKIFLDPNLILAESAMAKHKIKLCSQRLKSHMCLELLSLFILK